MFYPRFEWFSALKGKEVKVRKPGADDHLTDDFFKEFYLFPLICGKSA